MKQLYVAPAYPVYTHLVRPKLLNGGLGRAIPRFRSAVRPSPPVQGTAERSVGREPAASKKKLKREALKAFFTASKLYSSKALSKI